MSFIRNLTALNKKANDIIVQVADWSSSRGHNDPGERWFYPTPEDIKYIMKTFRDEGRADRSDVASVDKLLKSDLKDHILFYQPLGKDQPLIIVLQSAYQQSKLEQYGKSMVFFMMPHTRVKFFWGKKLDALHASH